MRFNSRPWRRLTYALWAPAYDLLAWPLKSARRKSIDQLMLRPGERVLLIGAGTGLDLPLLPRDVDVVAVDLVPAMLRVLQARAARDGRRVQIAVMDAEQLAFADARFDAVILHLILSVVPNPSRCAAEASRVLKPGGRAVVLDKFVADDGQPSIWRRLLNPFMNAFGTEITRKLRQILNGSVLTIESSQAAGRTGYLRLVLLVKPALPSEDR